MRAEWMECEFPSPRCCKHLPASTWHFIDPSPSLHPTPPLSPRLPTPSSKRSHLFNVSLFRATAPILQMSGEIFLTRRDGAAIKGNGTSAAEARTLIKKFKKKGKKKRVEMCEWWWERGWEDDDCRMKERKRHLLSISITYDVFVCWLFLLFWIIFPSVFSGKTHFSKLWAPQNKMPFTSILLGWIKILANNTETISTADTLVVL